MFIRKFVKEVIEEDGYKISRQITTFKFLNIPLYSHFVQIEKKAAPISPELRQKVYAADAWECVYCGDRNIKSFHCDHIIPQSRGGATTFDNLATACQSCNSSKHAWTPSESTNLLKYGRFLHLGGPDFSFLFNLFAKTYACSDTNKVIRSYNLGFSINSIAAAYAKEQFYGVNETFKMEDKSRRAINKMIYRTIKNPSKDFKPRCACKISVCKPDDYVCINENIVLNV
jgi:hypothetical protein